MENPSPNEPPDNFWKKAILTLVFFTLTPIALISSVLSLVAISSSESADSLNTYQNTLLSQESGVSLYASLPSEQPSISGEIIAKDARPQILSDYLSAYNSALEPHAEFIVKTADKYGLDYRLITAIAMKESGLCNVIPEDSHNCWGWGIHSQGTLKFDSYEEGIETVSKGLKENYVDIGLVSVEEIMSKYIPHSPGGAWAEGVSFYMQQMK